MLPSSLRAKGRERKLLLSVGKASTFLLSRSSGNRGWLANQTRSCGLLFSVCLSGSQASWPVECQTVPLWRGPASASARNVLGGGGGIRCSACLPPPAAQVMGTLFIYALFMIELFQDTPLEKMDEIVYYVNAVSRVLEFLVALCVVAYGTWESIFGEWSWMGASVIIIHCYFNVWLRAQSGWKSFLLRREATRKISVLPRATRGQLRDHNDVCAICFQVSSRHTGTCSASPFWKWGVLMNWLYCAACPTPSPTPSPLLVPSCCHLHLQCQSRCPGKSWPCTPVSSRALFPPTPCPGLWAPLGKIGGGGGCPLGGMRGLQKICRFSQ